MSRTPKYRRHATRRHLAFVEIAGKRQMLGRFDSPESRAKYHALLSDHLAGRLAKPEHKPCGTLSVAELCAQFWQWAKARYVKHGKPTSELHLYRIALRPVLALYGGALADQFTPPMLMHARQQLVARGMVRKKINQHAGRVRRVFKWGVQRQLVSAPTWQALLSIEPLRKGEATESQRVPSVSDDRIEAIRGDVPPTVWAMIQFQLLTGCRPGEACICRACDIDMSGATWLYRPYSSKSDHHDHIERVVYLGPRAQQLVRTWLTTDLTAYLWSPQAGRLDYFERATKNPSKRSKPRRFRGTRAPRDHYTTGSYADAIHRACDRVWPAPKELSDDERRQWRKAHRWSPNQLRHAAGTRVRSEFGIEMARVILGHRSAVTTEIYAEADLRKAEEIQLRLG